MRGWEWGLVGWLHRWTTTERAAWKKVVPAVARARKLALQAKKLAGRMGVDGRRGVVRGWLDAAVACDTHPTSLLASCHHFLRSSMSAVSSAVGQTWQRKKVSLWECRASSSIVFHASKVRACSATSFRKSFLSRDSHGRWFVEGMGLERCFRVGVIFSRCGLRFVDVRDRGKSLWFSFFFGKWLFARVRRCLERYFRDRFRGVDRENCENCVIVKCWGGRL